MHRGVGNGRDIKSPLTGERPALAKQAERTAIRLDQTMRATAKQAAPEIAVGNARITKLLFTDHSYRCRSGAAVATPSCCLEDESVIRPSLLRPQGSCKRRELTSSQRLAKGGPRHEPVRELDARQMERKLTPMLAQEVVIE